MENENLKELKKKMESNNEVVDSASNATVTQGYYPDKLARKEVKEKKISPLSNDKWAKNISVAMRNLVYILRNNNDIRRYTALGIKNYLIQKGEIEGKNIAVFFFWNKFRVIVDGIVRDFSYKEKFFLTCFIASFSSFSNVAQKTINLFCEHEINKATSDVINVEEIDKVIADNQQYVDNDKNIPEE